MFSRVVLLAEDVDRNLLVFETIEVLLPSSSSRRTWIEISIRSAQVGDADVVLLAEDVDRNLSA